MQFLSDFIEDLIYYINQDWKKVGAVILIIFFAAFTAGFCAGKVVEQSVCELDNGK